MNVIAVLLVIILIFLLLAGVVLLWLVLSVSAKARRVEKNVKKAYTNIDDASTLASAVSAGMTFTSGLIDGARKHQAKKRQKRRSNQQ